MSCSSSEDLFEGYLDATLTPVQRARLLAHLKTCGACTGVLEELRVVDALLATPRTVTLPANFTFATMAEVRSRPRPHRSAAPVAAYLVSYLVAAWLLVAAGCFLAPSAMRAFGEAALGASVQITHALGFVAQNGWHAADDLSGLGTLLGTALFLDLLVALALVGFAVVRPRLTERVRP